MEESCKLCGAEIWEFYDTWIDDEGVIQGVCRSCNSKLLLAYTPKGVPEARLFKYSGLRGKPPHIRDSC